MSSANATLARTMAAQPVIPVLKIDRIEDAVPLAQALSEGGMNIIEITLRTPVALACIHEASQAFPEMLVGAGTILTARDYEEAIRAGARFIVSPGVTAPLLDVANDSDIALLPGAATVSEVMALRDRDYEFMKFFPAEQSGGAAFLKAVSSPLAGAKFCPTGGINIGNLRDYLGLPNVICAGGSWMAPESDIKAGNWNAITEKARDALLAAKAS